jgi:hypothetical protein
VSRIHGKSYSLEEWFEVVGNEVLSRFGRFVDILDWRNPLDGLRLPQSPEDLFRWVYPLCLRMNQCPYFEEALFSPPPELTFQVLYVEAHFRVITETVSTARFKRLKGYEARAKCLAKALALPDSAPGYAEQQLRGVKIG